MDLFVVNRYYGDEKSSIFLIEKQSSHQEEEHITNNNQIEDMSIVKKKKTRGEIPDTTCFENTEFCDTKYPSSEKKKTKRKRIENSEEQFENNVTTEQRHETIEINEAVDHVMLINKKKKKNNRNTKDPNEEENGYENKSKSLEIAENNTDTFETNHTSTKSKNSKKDRGNNEHEVTNAVLSKKNKRKIDLVEARTSPANDIIYLENIKNTKNNKKSKSTKLISDVNELMTENYETLDRNKKGIQNKSKIKSLEISKGTEKDITHNPSPNKETEQKMSPQNTNTNKSNIINKEEIVNLGSKTDETWKKPKKRFRQRSSYKNKPQKGRKDEGSKINEEAKEGNSEEEKENKNDLGGFQVIGNMKFQGKKKVKRVLPDWLAKPTVISVNLKNLKGKVDHVVELDAYFKKLLKQNKVSHLFPVQSELIPFLLKQHSRRTLFWPRDVCVSAPTGSGKTLAFVLPILQLLQHRVVPRIRALIVLPTQDLASQVYSVFKSYVKGTKLQVILTVGSSPIQEEQQKLVAWDVLTEKHVSLVDIVVTTPGRLVDHLTNSPGFDLSSLKFLVVDEADRMIDNNDCNWLLHINKYINYQGLNSVPPLTLHTFLTYPSRPQRLLFSATLSHDPEKLHQLGLFQPKLFTSIVETSDDKVPTAGEETEMPSGFIGKFTTPAELKEKVTTCSTVLKPLVVYHLIKKHAMKQVLCFVNTAQGAHRLAKLLHLIEKSNPAVGNKLNIAEVYSGMKFEQRNKIIENFRRRKVDLFLQMRSLFDQVRRKANSRQEFAYRPILTRNRVYRVVATDNLARGIDVENIDVVINYEAPDNIKKYIHRIGRTARGGRQGTGVTLVTEHERNSFLKMLSSVGKHNTEDLECSEAELEHLEDVYAKALQLLKKDVEREGEMTLKIAKAQKKGTKIKKNQTVLDGSAKKNVKTGAQKKTSNKKNEKKSNRNGMQMKNSNEKKAVDKKVENQVPKTVKRNEIKKVANKNMKSQGRSSNKSKKKKANRKTVGVKIIRNEGEKKNAVKRNKKTRMKKQLKKKQVHNKEAQNKTNKS